MNKRPLGLVVIVFYKLLIALILAIIAIILILASDQPQQLITFSESYIFSDFYILEERLEFIEQLLEKFLSSGHKNLHFSGILAGIYAAATAIQAIGLWYKKAWARIIVLGVVGISIPVEVLELFRGVTILKLTIFVVNVAVFWYLLHHFPKHSR